MNSGNFLEVSQALQHILGLAEILREGGRLGPDQHELVDGILRSTRGLLGELEASRTSGLRDAAQMDTRPLTKDFHLVELFAGLQMVVEAGVTDPDHRLRFEFDPDLEVDLHGQAGTLLQRLLTLLENRMRFARARDIVLYARSEPLGGDDLLLHFEVGEGDRRPVAFSFGAKRQRPA